MFTESNRGAGEKESILQGKVRRCFPASRYSRNSSLLTSTILPGLSQSLQTSLLSLSGLEGGLGTAGSPTAKNNQPLPRCDRNRRKHIVKFRGGPVGFPQSHLSFGTRACNLCSSWDRTLLLPLAIMSFSWIKKNTVNEKEQGGAGGWERFGDLCRTAKATGP